MFWGELKILEIFKISSEIARRSLLTTRIKKYFFTQPNYRGVIALSEVILPIIMYRQKNLQPIPMAPRSKVWVCGRSLAGSWDCGFESWMSVCCECCVLSGRGLCDGPITRPEKSYPCGAYECDLEISKMRGPRPTGVVEP